MTSSTERSAPEGTPDREAQTRAKFQPTQLVPQVLVPEAWDPINKVEMISHHCNTPANDARKVQAWDG